MHFFYLVAFSARKMEVDEGKDLSLGIEPIKPSNSWQGADVWKKPLPSGEEILVYTLPDRPGILQPLYMPGVIREKEPTSLQYETEGLDRRILALLGRALSPQQQATLLLELAHSIPIDPKHAAYAFESIIAEQWATNNGKPRRKPIRVEKIWRIFRGRENDDISLDEFLPDFSHTSSPRYRVSETISWLNTKLPDFNLIIDTVRVRPTFYRLCWYYAP